MTYEIMHSETPVAQIDTQGHCHIFSKKFMPYNLYLKETDDDPLNNLFNFYFLCANGTLPSKRQHKDVILKSLNLTSKESAQIALQCHCLSLTDVYWVRNSNKSITFQEINLYDDHSENPLIDASLLGKQITLQSLKGIEKDLSTDGCFPKAWLGNTLLKGGNPTAVRNEILASKICQCFQCNQVLYKEGKYKGELVSISNLFTSKEYSIVSKEAFDIYAVNHDIDPIKYILSFFAYDYIEGVNCLTIPTQMTQKEVATEAVKKIGLNQISHINPNWFQHDQQKYEMFLKRLSILKEVIQQ